MLLHWFVLPTGLLWVCDFLRGFISLFGCSLGCTLFRLGCGFGSCYCWGWVWLLAFMFVGMYCGGWFVWVCD